MKCSAYTLPVPRCSHKTDRSVVRCVVSVQIDLLLTVLVLKLTEVLCSKRRSLYDLTIL